MQFKEGMEQEYLDWKVKNEPKKGGDIGYGMAIFTWAEDWAELMEKEIEAGAVLEDIADSTSHKSGDGGGYTGFQYNVVIQVLGLCWKYGEELRQWHNLDVQLHDEGEKANEKGGYLNSAVLNIGR